MQQDVIKLDPIFKSEGIYNYEYIEAMRNCKPRNKYFVAPQKGGQEELLVSPASITIYGGKRGGGKTASLMLNGLYYIDEPYFNGAIFRKEKDDAKRAGGLIGESHFFFNNFGYYNKSDQDRTWNFKSGAKLNFGYYSDGYSDFVKRYQGLQIPYIGIDEITHMPFKHFKYLITCNRNAYGYENRIIGTCNPDPESWVASFIGGTYTNFKGENCLKWVGDDGFVVNSGKILYCYMWGERVDQIYWGETKEDVYEQAKEKIDGLWNDELAQFGNKLDLFIFSVTFIEGRLEENKILLENDPSYFKNLAQQSEEQQMRDLLGNWKFKSGAEGLISRDDLEAVLSNTEQRNDYRCVTADIATTGGDSAVLFYWEGFHCCDVEVMKIDSATLLTRIKNFLGRHGVPDENFCYDATGIGKYIEGFIPKAKPFFGNSMPTDKREITVGNIKQNVSNYDNLRAQCIDLCCDRIKMRGYSFDTELLNQKFLGKLLKDHFREEYISFQRDERSLNGKFRIVPKTDIKARIGHSPDMMDTWYMREYLELLKQTNKPIRRIGACYL